MTDRYEVTVRDKNFDVDVLQKAGNSRRFTVGSIPLSCTVSRAGRPECADVHYAVQAPDSVDIPAQELYTASEYETVLNDDEMRGHARFVIGQWLRQSAEAQEI